MRPLLLLLIILTTWNVKNSFSANLYSRGDGNWSAIGTWSYTPGGASCGCIPTTSDNVTIDHHIMMDKHLTNVASNNNGITGILRINATGWLDGGSTYDLDIRSTGVLHLCGTLTVRDMIFSNGSTVYVCPGGNLVVNRDFQNKNNSNNVIIDGNMTVNGSFTNGNGGVIGGAGQVTITNGPVANTGNTMGCVGYNPCTTYPCGIISPCATPLPIELLSFTASYNSPDVILKWITQTEINNDYFTVERSSDSRRFFPIVQVEGAGNSSVQLHYTSYDHSPMNGISYYRLKQTDYDGQFSYSEPVAVRVRNSRTFSLYPSLIHASNPGFYFSVPSGNENAKLSVFDAAGKLILSEDISSGTTAGDLHYLKLPELSAGTYSVSAVFESGVENARFIICSE